MEAVQQKMMEVVLGLYSVMSSVQRTTHTYMYVVHRWYSLAWTRLYWPFYFLRIILWYVLFCLSERKWSINNHSVYSDNNRSTYIDLDVRTYS